ncbi:MAG: hypothetical protein EXS25_07550 [Pedosphaera sp.]|nr:hypothetical protein [Pedosphaera sp.]
MTDSLPTSSIQRFWDLTLTPTLPDLDGGPRLGIRPKVSLQDSIDLLLSDLATAPRQSVLILATAFLFNDHHDDAHDLIEDLKCPEGCLIHSLLHRREPDYWNARYWLRRNPNHPIYRRLTSYLKAQSMGAAEMIVFQRLTLSGVVDPIALVDECVNYAGKPDQLESLFLKRVQHAEFHALAEHLIA